MKKLIIKPGFEFIFTLSLFAVLGLPPLVFGQSTPTEQQITIVNGDTTVNGKNIKELSAKDRQAALKDISQIAAIKPVPGQAPLMANNTRRKTMVMKYKFKDSSANKAARAEWRTKRAEEDPMMDFSRKNTQDFNYITTDNNGVSTHMSFRVTEPTGALHDMASTPEQAQLDKLDVQDLTIVPEFAAGTTVLLFTLPSKAIAEVMLKDSKGNIIWSDKVLKGSFTKTFALGLNGIYYLRIKQGNKLAVKKIYKDQM